MPDFLTRNASDEDLKNYPLFFAKAPLFNTLNLIPDPPGLNSLLSRVTGKSVEKLIFFGDQPVFYVCYHKGHFGNTIDTMIFDPGSLEDYQSLYTEVRKECLEKPGILGNHGKFEYYTVDEPLNHEFLNGLGFILAKNHRIMNTLLDVRIKPEFKEVAGCEMVEVRSREDIRDRVRVQNEVFDNRNRIPLVFNDIQKEMKNENYVPELSLLLRLGGVSCAYGQIIHNPYGYYLVNFGVVPDYQGQGLSHILLEELLERARGMGLNQIMLEVYEDNFRAVKLYEKHGFRKFYNKCQWVYLYDAQV